MSDRSAAPLRTTCRVQNTCNSEANMSLQLMLRTTELGRYVYEMMDQLQENPNEKIINWTLSCDSAEAHRFFRKNWIVLIKYGFYHLSTKRIGSWGKWKEISLERGLKDHAKVVLQQ